jgi:hypothetical protein
MKNRVEFVKALFPVGTRIVLAKMDDPQAPPRGTKGTVTGVDDLGDLLVAWDNGSGLKAILGQDQFYHDDEGATRFIGDQEAAELFCYRLRDMGLKPEMIVRNWGDGCVEFVVRLKEEV